jgi:hypothetical protein
MWQSERRFMKRKKQKDLGFAPQPWQKIVFYMVGGLEPFQNLVQILRATWQISKF